MDLENPAAIDDGVTNNTKTLGMFLITPASAESASNYLARSGRFPKIGKIFTQIIVTYVVQMK